MMRVGFIGTGTMGNPMVACLLQAGHEVTVYDVRREAAANLLELGARWAATPRQAAQGSEVVITSLPGPKEVEHVVLDPAEGILAALTRGAAYIDTTTNSPTLVRRIAAACAERGVEMLDGPVSGKAPTLTIMLGGDPATLAKYKPLLDVIAQNIFHVGGIGAGCVAKLVTQYIGYANFVAAAEGLLIAAKAGVDVDMIAEIVPVSAASGRLFDFYPRAIFKREFSSPGPLDIIAKDLGLACDLAREIGAPHRLGEQAEEMFKQGQARGLGQQGFPTVVQLLEEEAGVELRSGT